MVSIFPILVLNARPAAGKSEIIHYLKEVPLEERKERFHIGSLKILDDFRMLWTWFEEDDLLEKEFGYPRLHSTPDHYFNEQVYWHLLIRRLSLEYEKVQRDVTEKGTVLIEFSRGAEHGGYREAYQHLSDMILERAACIYVQVSFDESLRKNRKRFNPDRPDSILQHALEDEKMKKIYLEDDWFQFTASNPVHLSVRNIQIPYVVFENEDDVTTQGGSELSLRLERVLGRLWKTWEQMH
ncbi:MAG: hypothetical protein A2Z14_19540 [Chloroflexi bacterium RBG_16_48_8]|nr:MAG: hypothetical protein A2Z14_19540 [Chloroflexi bacterium RBG_16_48_8]